MSNPLTTALTGVCPHCRRGPMFTGVFLIRDSCATCGAVFFRDPGSWTGSTVVAYMLGSGFACVLFTILWATGTLELWSGWAIATLVCGFMLLTYRFSKAFWVGILHNMEQVYPDPDWRPESERPTKPRKKRLDLKNRT